MESWRLTVSLDYRWGFEGTLRAAHGNKLRLFQNDHGAFTVLTGTHKGMPNLYLSARNGRTLMEASPRRGL